MKVIGYQNEQLSNNNTATVTDVRRPGKAFLPKKTARVGEKAAKWEVLVFFERYSQEEKQYRY